MKVKAKVRVTQSKGDLGNHHVYVLAVAKSLCNNRVAETNKQRDIWPVCICGSQVCKVTSCSPLVLAVAKSLRNSKETEKCNAYHTSKYDNEHYTVIF